VVLGVEEGVVLFDSSLLKEDALFLSGTAGRCENKNCTGGQAQTRKDHREAWREKSGVGRNYS
jgi:hypothetical protein